jgi:hypothetical protein
MTRKLFAGGVVLAAALVVCVSPISAQSRLESANYAIIDSNLDSAAGSSDSANYSLLQSINPTADSRATSGSYALGSGFPNGIQANVPLVRCFETSTDDVIGGATNTSCTDPALTAAVGGSDSIVGNGMLGVCGSPGCYDRAKIEVNPQNNPIDTLYLVAISVDNFADPSKTYYLKNDKTIGTTIAVSNYMTICQLHGYDSRVTTCDDSADGSWSQSRQEFNVVGIAGMATWYVKVRALSGDFTETQYSPTVSATMQAPTISFDLDVSASDVNTNGPYGIALGSLSPTVTTATHFIWVDLSTNAFSGASVMVADLNNGLKKASGATYTIPSETEDLSTPDGDGGFGLQATNAAQTSMGPFQRTAPFTFGVGNSVRGISTTPQTIFFTDTTSTNRGPVAGGRGQITVKARADVGVPSGIYGDTITFTVSANW